MKFEVAIVVCAQLEGDRTSLPVDSQQVNPAPGIDKDAELAYSDQGTAANSSGFISNSGIRGPFVGKGFHLLED